MVQVADTVWKDLQPLNVSVDFGMLEEEFAARDIGKNAGSRIKAVRPSRLTILQMQRSNNVAVFLNRLKMTTSEVRTLRIFKNRVARDAATLHCAWR